jgi:hypothetical protein
MAAVIVAALLSALVRQGRLTLPSIRRAPSQPEDVILAAFEAAKLGKVQLYLSFFTDKTRADLERSLAEMGEEAFGRNLVENTAPVKGVALSDTAAQSDGRVFVRVEYVYADKNDVQQYILRRERGDRGPWRICEVSASQRIKTLIPYGTEAVPLAR